MSQVRSPIRNRTLTLDICQSCASIWFDAAEFELVPRAAPAPGARPLPESVREEIALAGLESLRKRAQAEAGSGGPEGWQWLPAIFGLPVECDAPRLSREPWLTWSIALATFLVMLYSWNNLGEIINQWGFIPSAWSRHSGLTLATSFFLHGGIFHIIGNVYFLLVFGDNVEDHLGRVGFVLLLVCAHLAGMLAHGLFDPRADVPCVGASAGISGIIAYYAIAFPKVKLGIMLRYFFIFRWIRIPALGALVLFAIFQTLGAVLQIRGFAGVSYLGHIGGLIIGGAGGIAIYLARRHAKQAGLGKGYRTVALEHMRKQT